MENTVTILTKACQAVYDQMDRRTGFDYLIHQTVMEKIEAALKAAAALPVRLGPMPEDRMSSAFVEIGEYNGSQYQYEGDADLLLGSDGNVYARVGRLADIPYVEVDT